MISSGKRPDRKPDDKRLPPPMITILLHKSTLQPITDKKVSVSVFTSDHVNENLGFPQEYERMTRCDSPAD